MKTNEDMKWLCENARTLERFAGQCVVFSIKEGLVSKGDSLEAALKSARSRKIAAPPFVFHVPSKQELEGPFPSLRQKSSDRG